MTEWAGIEEFRAICGMVDPVMCLGRARGFAIPQKWEDFLSGGWREFEDGTECDGRDGRPQLVAADVGALWAEAGALCSALVAQSTDKRGPVLPVSLGCFGFVFFLFRGSRLWPARRCLGGVVSAILGQFSGSVCW